MLYETNRLILKTIELSDFDILKDYLVRNRNFLSEWEPKRETSYYENDNILQIIKEDSYNDSNQSKITLYILPKGENRIIGSVTLSNIVRGVFLSCFLGYKLDKDEINKGYMTEAIEKVINIAFNQLKLHRIEANIMPRNKQSIKVVKKLGFEYEGLSKSYLKINSKWEDHEHYALLNPNLD